MVYIDYFGGMHGNFLEFLIAKHIFCLPKYKNWFPFKDSGVSHLKHRVPPYKYVCADHFTYNPNPHSYITVDEHVSNVLIQILAKPNHLQDVLVFNTWQRAGETPVNFCSIDSILTKIESHGEKSRQSIRNILYWQILDKTYIDANTNFIKYQLPTITIDFHNFYTYDSLILELEKIANATTGLLDKTDIEQAWLMFMQLNVGYHIKLKIDKMFLDMLEDKNVNFNLDIYEEASFNSRLANYFNIHNDICAFGNDYPSDTLSMAKDIKQVMKNRNPEFLLELPISQQLDKIVL
jgi:hypothetical protein